ncbi:hypothetical protein EB001_03590 [bacterium]|nr:hypothetical protein [bacterium]
MHPLMGDLSGKTLDELLETVNGLHKKMTWLGRMGNNVMIQQIRNVVDTYQEEINKRYRAEAEATKKNPIFKDSLDVG